MSFITWKEEKPIPTPAPRREYKPRAKKPKITEQMMNEFMKFVATCDVEDYPKYRSVITQYQKHRRNARFQLLELFALWLEQ